MVFVLLSALLAKCLQTSRSGAVNLSDRFTAKKKKLDLVFFFAPSVGISEEVALITRRFDVTAGRGLYDRSDVGDRAMWGSARWESRVDKGAGVC